jgi:cyanophycin synthetase
VEWRGVSGQIYFQHRVAEYERMWREVARTLGAEFSQLTKEIWEIRIRKNATRVSNYQLEYDNPVILRMAGNKPLVHELLSRHGLPVPDHRVFTLGEIEGVYDFLDRYREGCVVKPANGYGGQGVTTHIRTHRELRRAAVLASLYSPELLIERQIPGESYRLLILNGRMVDAVCRRGLHLVGDGASSVRGLIERANRDREAQDISPIEIDRDCEFTLGYQNLSLSYVPDKSADVLINSVNESRRKQVEVRTVYNENVTTVMCPAIVRQAESAAAIIGSRLLGVDILARRTDVPLEESGGVINEVNTTPALHHHYEARREKYPRAALLAIQALLLRQ